MLNSLNTRPCVPVYRPDSRLHRVIFSTYFSNIFFSHTSKMDRTPLGSLCISEQITLLRRPLKRLIFRDTRLFAETSVRWPKYRHNRMSLNVLMSIDTAH